MMNYNELHDTNELSRFFLRLIETTGEAQRKNRVKIAAINAKYASGLMTFSEFVQSWIDACLGDGRSAGRVRREPKAARTSAGRIALFGDFPSNAY